MSNNSSNTIVGILAGTVIGATLGILFAPEKGSVVRQKIADEVASRKDQLSEQASHLKDRVVDAVSEKKLSLDDQVEHIVSDVSYKAEDVIATLEKKLSELKAKNKKYQKS